MAVALRCRVAWQAKKRWKSARRNSDARVRKLYVVLSRAPFLLFSLVLNFFPLGRWQASLARSLFKCLFEIFSADIYDGDKNERDDLPSPEVSVVASRATQMVELLSSDNLALREKLENMQSKMNNLQMVRNKQKKIAGLKKLTQQEMGSL